MASVSLRDNVVPPHPGRVGSYPRIRNPSISLQLTPTTRGRERGSPGSILPRTVWKPQHTGLMLFGWGSWSQRATRIAPPAKVEVAPLTGKLRSHPRIINRSISLQFQQTGAKVDSAPHGVETPTKGISLLIGVRQASGFGFRADLIGGNILPDFVYYICEFFIEIRRRSVTICEIQQPRKIAKC